MYSNKDYVRSGIIATSLIIVAVIFVVILRWDVERRSDILSSQLQNVSKQNASISQLASLQIDSQKAKGYSAQLDQLVMKHDQIFELRKEMLDMAQQNNLTSEIVFGADTKSGDNIYQTDLSVKLNGQSNLNNFLNFLQAFENGKYFAKVKSIDFSQDGQAFNASMETTITSFKD